MSTLPCVIPPPDGSPHTHTVIFLHGRDSNAVEFASEFFESEASGPEANRTMTSLFPTIRWVFPQARTLRSARFDSDMSQWFDMWSLDNVQERSEMQVAGLRSSIETVLQTIKDEERILPRDRIFLAGISQGFATALAVLFADGQGSFAGLCGFSSWMPLLDEAISILCGHSDPVERLSSMQRLYLGDNAEARTKESSVLVSQLTSTPILLEHCRDDEIISVENGYRMRNFLGPLGFKVQWKEYNEGGHWFNEPQGIDDFSGFLRMAMRGQKRGLRGGSETGQL